MIQNVKGTLDFGMNSKIIGKLKSLKAIKHLTWGLEHTIPAYNRISHNNTVVPTLEEFFLQVVVPEMSMKECEKTYGLYFRTMLAFFAISHKDECERIRIQAQERDAPKTDAKNAPDVPKSNAKASSTDVDTRLDKMETSIDMILQALTK